MRYTQVNPQLGVGDNIWQKVESFRQEQAARIAIENRLSTRLKVKNNRRLSDFFTNPKTIGD